MNKKMLEKRMARLQSKIETLTSRALASEDVAEVRSINEQITELKEDLADIQEELASMQEERAMPPVDAKVVNGGMSALGSFKAPEQRQDEVGSASMEYRKAFMAYALRGTAIPAELRSGENVNTANAGAVIPMTIINQVINTVRKRYGNLYSKVRKTSIKGGVEYPIGALEASFKWISESTVSPRQNIGTPAKVTFSEHVAEIRIAQTFLSNLISLTDFEAKFTEIIVRAYLQAMDYGIVNGSGQGQMLGILNDARVTNTVTMTAAQMSDWTKWRKNFFALLPLGYRSGEFIFPISTVDTYLETMADSNNNPIFRQATGLEVGDGDAANPSGRFFGRNISLVEEDIIPDFDTAQAGDVIGIYWQPEEYAINENYGFTMRRYFDEETNEWVDKALVVVDGKVLNPTGIYKIIKG